MLHQKGIVVAVVMANWVALLFTLLRMGEIGQSVKMECVIAGGAISQMSRDPDRKNLIATMNQIDLQNHGRMNNKRTSSISLNNDIWKTSGRDFETLTEMFLMLQYYNSN